MTSLLMLPRAINSLVWSADQLKSKIRPDVKRLSCFASDPTNG